MNKNTIKNIVLIILILIAAILIGYIIILGKTNPPSEVKYVIQEDTIVIHHYDTIKVEKIKYKERKVLDTIYVKDTVLVNELKLYKDSLSEIYISGINPNIDSIKYFIDKDTVYINKEIEKTIILKEKPKKIHLSAQLGFGALYGLINKQFDIGPYVGFGISYDIW